MYTFSSCKERCSDSYLQYPTVTNDTAKDGLSNNEICNVQLKSKPLKRFDLSLDNRGKLFSFYRFREIRN